MNTRLLSSVNRDPIQPSVPTDLRLHDSLTLSVSAQALASVSVLGQSTSMTLGAVLVSIPFI
ncbi:hypothetical protein DPMN_165626 [Dreissena polymorpha]|uniref:Uncharacterized protein n=1 Tax=Dreissena polymorpha TaxID=45954 RepID=A0A9D4F106_DREPO|nr:hypothetical protein DPMN_165626 [Dreissena polymorpha]